MSARPVGFLSAVQFLTRVPVPGCAFRLDLAVVWFPVVGGLLGGTLALVDYGLRWLATPSLLASVLVVVLLLALTGALHADGLMDAADAVFAHATPERRLEIMRDPHVGAFGVVALVCVVGLKVAAIDSLPPERRVPILVLAPMLGRWSIVLLATAFPYGRSVGLGSGLKAGATPLRLLLASIVPVIVCSLAGPLGIAVGVLAAASALLLGAWLMRLLPGLTGDCYGAGCEVTEVVVLVVAAILAYALG